MKIPVVIMSTRPKIIHWQKRLWDDYRLPYCGSVMLHGSFKRLEMDESAVNCPHCLELLERRTRYPEICLPVHLLPMEQKKLF